MRLPRAFPAFLGAFWLVLGPIAAYAANDPEPGGVKSWAMAAALALVAPLVGRYLYLKGPAWVVDWILKKSRDILEAKGIEDQDLKELVSGVFLLLVRFAEKKIPDSGMGAERKALIRSTAARVPMLGKWLENPGNAKKFDDEIEKAVAKLNAGFQDIVKPKI